MNTRNLLKNIDNLKGETLRKFIARRGLFVRIEIPEDYRDLEPEIKFGRSILDLALLDSLWNSEIFYWADKNNSDFKIVCTIALLDPETTEERFKTVMGLLKK